MNATLLKSGVKKPVASAVSGASKAGSSSPSLKLVGGSSVTKPPPLKPFAHQAKSLKHDATTASVFDCSDPGLGKSAVRIWAFAKRRKAGGGCALVLAQKSLLRSVWANDFRKFEPTMKTSVSTAGKHEEAFAVDADVYITNFDTVKWLAKKKKAFFEKFSELIIDESPAFKHHTSQRSRAVAKLAGYFKHKSCLTGTPNGNSITDVWHQAYILDGGKRLGSSFYSFRNSVCEPKQVGRDVNAIKWTDKEGAEEAVFALLADITIRHTAEKCLDIPPNREYTVPFTMAPRHKQAYDEMEEQQLLTIFGPPARRARFRLTGQACPPIGTVSAIHAGVLTNKLLQIASGAVYENPDKYHVIDTGRYEMILDLIEARKHSLTFFLWKHQRDLLLKEAEKRGITYALIDGSVGESERERIVREYQAGAFQTLFAHPKSAAHGLTLTRGTATIWASPTYDLEIFKQGSRRQARMGQTQKTETIVVVAEGSVEQHVYDLMLGKNARMTNLLDLMSTL